MESTPNLFAFIIWAEQSLDPTANGQVTLASIALTKVTFLHESLLVFRFQFERPDIRSKRIDRHTLTVPPL